MAQATTTTVELTYEVQEQVRLAKTELGEMLANKKQIVVKIGHALSRDPSFAETPHKICAKIIAEFAAEIKARAISEETIREACLPEWKDQARAAAGAKGAAVSAAKSREKSDDESAPAVSASAFEELTAKVNRMEERFGSLKSAAEKLVDGAKREGDSVRVPLDLFTALVDEVKG